jgi:hypothetical protein
VDVRILEAHAHLGKNKRAEVVDMFKSVVIGTVMILEIPEAVNLFASFLTLGSDK